MNVRRLLLLSAALLAPLPLQAQDGVLFRIETTHTTPEGTTVDTVEMRIEGEKVAVPQAEMSTGMIFRGDQHRMIAVDHGRQAYMVVDSAMVRGMASQMDAAMSQLDAMMENLPEDQQAAIRRAREQAGAGGMPAMPGMEMEGMETPPPAEIRPTDDRDTMHGYSVRKYDVYRGDRKVREIWTADWSDIEGAAEARAAFQSMADFFDDVMSQMPQMPGGQGFDNPWTEVGIENGFPVVTREFAEDGSVERESALIENGRVTVEPADFEAPVGYTQIQPGMGMGG